MVTSRMMLKSRDTVLDTSHGRKGDIMSGWKSMNHKNTMTCLKEIDSTTQASQSLLFEVCTQSPYGDARRTAIRRLKNPALLVKVAWTESDQEICKAAIKKLPDDSSLLQVAEHFFDDRYFCSLAINRINDQEMLFRIAQQHIYPECRVAAVKRIDKQELLAGIARFNTDAEARKAAVIGLKDQRELAAIACKDPNSWVRRAAIDRLTDPQFVVDVAHSNNMRFIRSCALNRLQEIGQNVELSPAIIEPLLDLLDESETVVEVATLAQQAGVDWISRSTTATIQALYDALIEGKGWHPAFMIEKAIKHLFETRLDLREALLDRVWTNPYTDRTIVFSQ